jgi:hypothetical protein
MKLDEEYSIKSDGVGTTLQLETPRQREKDGKLIDFIFTDKWYYLTVEQALRKYLDLKLENCEDVKDCLKRIEEVKQIISKIK